jgi:YggT family protein
MREQVRLNESVDRREEVRVSRHNGLERREHIIQDKGAERRQFVAKLTEVVWLMTGILEALIALRFILKLIAANPQNPFAQFVYNITYLFLWPFLNLTATPSVGGIIVLEIPSLIGMLVYALLAWLAVSILQLFANRSSTRTISVEEIRR